MARGRAKTMVLVEQVEVRSREKHPDDDWRDMKATYIFLKMTGHIIKWFLAGRGSKFNGDGAHHLAKVIWYIQRWFHIEDQPYFLKNDDRPKSRTKMAKKYVSNAVLTLLDK